MYELSISCQYNFAYLFSFPQNQIQPCQTQEIVQLYALTVATMTHVVQMNKNIVTNVAHSLRKNKVIIC